MKIDLGQPRYLTPLEKAKEYYYNLLVHSKETVKMSAQIGHDLAPVVILVPVLATHDSHLIENFVEVHSHENTDIFTIVFYPNASLEVDPDRSKVQETVELLKELKLKYPKVDFRWMIDEDPPAEFTTIGAIRKELWDAVFLSIFDESASNHSTLTSIETEDLSESNLLKAYSIINREHLLINQDVDLVRYSRGTLEEYASIVVTLDLSWEGKPYQPIAYNCAGSHNKLPSHSNANMVVSFFDHLYYYARVSYEAGITMTATTYGEYGGFDSSSYTYEVAGFTHRSGKSIHYVDNLEFETSSRRLYEKFHKTSVKNIWGSAKTSTKEEFSDVDECRYVKAGDISRSRACDLILEWNDDEDFSHYLVLAAFFDWLTDDPEDYKKTLGNNRRSEYTYTVVYNYAIGRLKLLVDELRDNGFSYSDELFMSVEGKLTKKISELFLKEM